MGPRDHDPFGYSGPLRRADGKAPYNSYWWPMEGDSYVLRQWRPSVANGIPWDFRISLIPLNNGAWVSEGHTYSPQFPTRAAALADAAGRHRRFVTSMVFKGDGLGRRWRLENYTAVNAWLRHVADAERSRP